MKRRLRRFLMDRHRTLMRRTVCQSIKKRPCMCNIRQRPLLRVRLKLDLPQQSHQHQLLPRLQHLHQPSPQLQLLQLLPHQPPKRQLQHQLQPQKRPHQNQLRRTTMSQSAWTPFSRTTTREVIPMPSSNSLMKWKRIATTATKSNKHLPNQ